jgi:hypothetical protein
MKLLPKSSEDWSKLFFVPFRAYVIAAFAAEYLMQAYWPRHGGSAPDWVLLITFGYVISFFAFIVGGLAARAARRPETAFLHFVFAGIAFGFGAYSLRFLAST